MAIDWSTEPFARLYKRETDDDLLLSWQARAVWHEFLKRCDVSGHLATKRGVQGMAALLRIPPDVVEPALAELVDDGRIRSVNGVGFVAPNYVDANYVARSNGARQAAFRAKQRAVSVSDGNGSYGTSDSTADVVTPRNAESHGVTRGNENCQSYQSINHTNHQSPTANDAPASKPRRRGIPEDWEPRPEERQLARELGLNVETEADEFKSYWLGDGRPKKSWDQTFRNRLQQQGKRRPSRQTSFGQQQPQRPRKIREME